MSAEDRQALAVAATTVVGVEIAPYYRQVTRPGTGFVRLDRLDRDSTGFDYLARWQVIVLLPQDIASAEQWMEQRLTALVEALRTEMVVTAAIPSQITLDTGTVPGVVIEGSRAYE